MNEPISFIITSPYYDNGIKSLGSKCIYSMKKNTILEKQYKAISKYCKDREYEIIFVNNIDHTRTKKFLEKKNLNIRYVYLNKNNVNHGGCFLKGLELAKHDKVFNIECGLVISYHALADVIKNDKDCDINICCIGNKHKQNTDLEVGCVIQNSVIDNIFFGLDHKCIGIHCIHKEAKRYILENFKLEQDKNKYIFEIINSCISKHYVCKKTDLKSKDVHLIFNKKSLQQYIGVI